MAPVYKIKLRSNVEKPTSRLNQYLKAIKRGKKLPKSQCSVVVFKPHENRLASLLTRYLNRIGTLSAQRCEKYKNGILQRVQNKSKSYKKKTPKVKDGGVKATKVQKGNTQVVRWTDNCMKQFLSQKMSKDVMLWRPRSPETRQVQLHVPKRGLTASSTSVSKKRRVPQVTSVPSFAYPTWKTSTMSVTSTKSAPPTRRDKKRHKHWHKQLARHSFSSFKSQVGGISSETGKKRVARKKSSNLGYQFKINNRLKKKARDFLCKFVDQYLSSRCVDDVPDDPDYPNDEVNPSPWYKRDQKIYERMAAIGVMEPVLEVEEELSTDDKDTTSSAQTDRSTSPHKSPERPTWPEADLGYLQIGSGGTKVTSSKDKNEGSAREKTGKGHAIEGAANIKKTEILTTQSASTLKTNKPNTPKTNLSPQGSTLDKQQENPRSKIRKSGAKTEEIKAMTPSEPIIREANAKDLTTSSQSKSKEDPSKKMPISKSDISRRAGVGSETKQGTGIKTRKIFPDTVSKSSSFQGKSVAGRFRTRRTPSMVGKLKSHDRQAGDTASNITTASTELCSVELGNLSHIHTLSVDGVSYNARLPSDEYGPSPNMHFTGDSEKGPEELKRRLAEFWKTQESKCVETTEECIKKSEKISDKCDVPRATKKPQKSVKVFDSH